MLDDFLRDESDPAAFLDEIEKDATALNEASNSNYGFLGMTPFQRFVIAGLLLVMVLIIGVFFLLITDSISIPIY